MSCPMTEQDGRLAILILALRQLGGVGPKTLQTVLREHGSQIKSTNSIDSDFLKFLNVPLLSKALDRSPSAFLEAQDYAEDRISAANRLGLCVTHPLADNYPRRFQLRKSFPSLLFVRGDIRTLDGDKQVAIVGTRAPTDYGRQMAQGVSGQLASRGYAVVSGLALGCDTAAHEGAVYPPENQRQGDVPFAVVSNSSANRINWIWQLRNIQDPLYPLIADSHSKPTALDEPSKRYVASVQN